MEQTTETRTTQRKSRPPETGVVASDKGDKTIRVVVDRKVKHPLYGKYVRQRQVLHAHDEKNEAHIGDRVQVVSCRPLSRTKCWRLLKIVERAPGSE